MLSLTLALLLFLFPLAYSPGPGNLFFAANGARFGVLSTMPATLGYHGATWIVAVGIGLGFAEGIERYPQVFAAIRWIGCAYVLFLAWKLFRSGRIDHAAEAKPAGFLDGVVLLLLNPKAYLIMSLMFTQFLVGAQQSKGATVLLVASVFTVNNFFAFLLWTFVGDRLAARFRAGGTVQLNTVFAAILAAVGIWMLLP